MPQQDETPVVTEAPSSSTGGAGVRVGRPPSFRIIVVLAAVVFVLGIGGIIALYVLRTTAPQSIPFLTGGVGIKKYENTDFNFSIEAPRGWSSTVTNEDLLREVRFVEPLKGNESSDKAGVLTVTYFDLNNSAAAQKEKTVYFNDVQRTILGVGGGLDLAQNETVIIEAQSAVTVDGIDGYKARFKATNYQGVEGQTGHYYVLYLYVDKAIQYTINLHSVATDESLFRTADIILGSFKHL